MADKNMADVADKALDKATGAIGEMAEAVKKIAPQAWEIMVRQQIVEGVVYGVACTIAVVVSGIVAYRLWGRVNNGKEVYEDPMGPLPLIGLLCALATCIGFACQVPGYVMQAASPEYHAIKMLIEVAK